MSQCNLHFGDPLHTLLLNGFSEALRKKDGFFLKVSVKSLMLYVLLTVCVSRWPKVGTYSSLLKI